MSTTHSIVGAIVGWGLVAGGKDTVIWYEIDNTQDFPLGGIAAIVVSWVFSPVVSGIVAAIFFLITRTLILRSEHSYDRAYAFLPVLVFLCFFINAFYVLDKVCFDSYLVCTAPPAPCSMQSPTLRPGTHLSPGVQRLPVNLEVECMVAQAPWWPPGPVPARARADEVTLRCAGHFEAVESVNNAQVGVDRGDCGRGRRAAVHRRVHLAQTAPDAHARRGRRGCQGRPRGHQGRR